ncbi:MAG: histidine phosphatase family protein [Acutalibacteraceae bacterium]
MRLIIVRHADPNYAIDSLTRKGRKEAMLLSKRLQKINADFYYCSPLGRAKKTAHYTLKKVGKKAETLPWLREFEGAVIENGKKTVCWDRLPADWTADNAYYGESWYDTELMSGCDVKAKYNAVCKGIDELLKKHGYEHEGKIFRAVRSNHDTVVLFCHFGVECVLLSHIIGISPMPLWHNFVALPSSVTSLITEEREKGIASFRIQYFGDLSHLYAGNEEPSFAARFCECFDDDTRH